MNIHISYEGMRQQIQHAIRQPVGLGIQPGIEEGNAFLSKHTGKIANGDITYVQ